ncbi:MAG TPA: accessory Sec system protein Asp3 [Lactobacillaceae bacterium]|jgi:accessory secretory protein Asp3
MAENVIYWTPQTAKMATLPNVAFERLDYVVWENHYLPSGQAVARWTSFGGQADLPPLTPGGRYVIHREVTRDVRMFAYLVVNFYDANGALLQSQTRDEDDLIVQVPFETHAWSIDLVGAGMGKIIFSYLTIRPETTGILTHNDQRLNARAVYENVAGTDTSMLRVVFAEPTVGVVQYPTLTQVAHPTLLVADERPLAQFYLPDATVPEYDAEMTALITAAMKRMKAKTLELVGYGPISSYAALRFARLLKAQALISEDALEHPKVFFFDETGVLRHQQRLLAQTSVSLAVMKENALEVLHDVPYLAPIQSADLLPAAGRTARLARLAQIDTQRALSRQQQGKRGFFKRR